MAISYTIIPKMVACVILILAIGRISWVIKRRELGNRVSIREFLVSLHAFLFLCEIVAQISYYYLTKSLNGPESALWTDE